MWAGWRIEIIGGIFGRFQRKAAKVAEGAQRLVEMGFRRGELVECGFLQAMSLFEAVCNRAFLKHGGRKKEDTEREILNFKI
jgi:hypothetical protein